MDKHLENAVKVIYKRWRQSHIAVEGPHVHDEMLAGLLDQRLSEQELDFVKRHVPQCDACSQLLAAVLTVSSAEGDEVPVPEHAGVVVQRILDNQSHHSILDILIQIQGAVLELVRASGDVIMGEQIIPSPVLRSMHKQVSGKEIVIRKDFSEILLEVHVSRLQSGICAIKVIALDKKTLHRESGYTVILKQGVHELESAHADKGAVVFENISSGRYCLEIVQDQKMTGVIMLEIVTAK